MCGIAGYWKTPPARSAGGEAILSLARSLRHRGPDDEGFLLLDTAADAWVDCSGGESDAAVRAGLPPIEAAAFPHDLAMAHRRFSIVDLSPAGHQPMWSADRSVCISFNGEIYNHVELRSELEKLGAAFRTRSDTEVLIAAYQAWGTEAFGRLNGPWALALYDRRSRRLLLSRDRIGKAPLYWTRRNGGLFWASEIKALLRAPGAGGFDIRPQAIDDFIIHGWRDIDGTFWEGIEDFPPASFAWIGADLAVSPTSYWSPPLKRCDAAGFREADAVAELRCLLEDAVRIRLRADVPVALELSGGMDSSALLGIAAGALHTGVSAYTTEFADPACNEEPYARAAAERHGALVKYHVLHPGPDDFWQDADAFIRLEEEPFHSPNLHTNQQQRRLIQEHGIGVVINGSGGDEVFAGYPGEYLAPFFRHLRSAGRWKALFREAAASSELTWIGALKLLVKGALRADDAARARKRAERLLERTYVPGGAVAARPGKSGAFAARMLENLTDRQMNYWLRAGNKLTFGIPVESRLPFLDHRIVDFAFALPPECLIHNGWHKWILRLATQDLLPGSVVWRRKKMGFPFPLRSWLRRSRGAVQAGIAGTDCPFLDGRRLTAIYDRLEREDPELLWRMISVLLWWRRMVEDRPIPAPAEAHPPAGRVRPHPGTSSTAPESARRSAAPV